MGTGIEQASEILVFARYPEPGKCKTRLAKGVGEANALLIYRALLDHTLSIIRNLPYRKILMAEPPERALDGASWAPGMDAYLPQSDGDLGMRLESAADSAFKRGARKVLLLGCDCPQISKDSVLSSFDALNGHEVVLGPTDDGGYYLLGLKKAHASLFRNIPWSTDKVFAETLNILKNQTLSYLLLDAFFDVDTLEDFDRVKHLEPLKHLGIR